MSYSYTDVPPILLNSIQKVICHVETIQAMTTMWELICIVMMFYGVYVFYSALKGYYLDLKHGTPYKHGEHLVLRVVAGLLLVNFSPVIDTVLTLSNELMILAGNNNAAVMDMSTSASSCT